MGRNLPGSLHYSTPQAQRGSPGRNVTMPRAMWEQIDAVAKRRRVSVSELLREAWEGHAERSRALPPRTP